MKVVDAKAKSNRDGKKFLQDAFKLEQKRLQVELELSSESITHSGTKGEVNEKYFIKTLRQYLPKRYEVDQGIVIDSFGKTSDQIDVIIYDPQYTPTLLDQESHRYIPAEAVYAVFEVKPTIDKSYLIYAAEKAESVRKLHRTSVNIMHSDGSKPPKEPFHIISGIVASKIEWVDDFKSTIFQQHHKLLTNNQTIDCGLAVSGSSFDYVKNNYIFGPSEQALIFFLFRLLGKLQSMGTVTAIDWTAYASVIANK